MNLNIQSIIYEALKEVNYKTLVKMASDCCSEGGAGNDGGGLLS